MKIKLKHRSDCILIECSELTKDQINKLCEIFITNNSHSKEYKTRRIRSRVYEINPKYWETALVLPTEHFVKKKSHVIQTETNKKIRKLLGESK